jgi:hypothetical protein
VAQPAGSDAPRDVPGTAFELVTANLEWEFSAGAAEHDPVDAAVVALARDSGMFRAVLRTWTRDPAAGWVRVLIGYATQAADPARAALVAAARAGGAARTCVEVVAPTGLSDVHRWLELRCVPLWRAEMYPHLWPAAGGSSRPPAAPPPALDPDALFRGGPAEPDEAAQRLIAWAARRPTVLGLVVAVTGPAAAPQRVYGVVLDAAGGAGHDAEDDEAVRAEARAALGELAGGVHIELFAPSRGLSPLHLRLYRGSTRLWTRRADRPTRTPAADKGPAIDLDLGQLVERTEVEDELLDGGLTLVGLTQIEPVAELSADERDGRDECDRALLEWAGAHPNLLAVTRAAVTVRGHPTRVYLLAVDPEADRAAVRHGAGAALLGRGLTRCGVELFCPLEPIPRFYLDLYTKGAQLWRSDRKLGRPASTLATGQPAADG